MCLGGLDCAVDLQKDRRRSAGIVAEAEGKDKDGRGPPPGWESHYAITIMRHGVRSPV
jgi:hypothetical protein